MMYGSIIVLFIHFKFCNAYAIRLGNAEQIRMNSLSKRSLRRVLAFRVRVSNWLTRTASALVVCARKTILNNAYNTAIKTVLATYVIYHNLRSAGT